MALDIIFGTDGWRGRIAEDYTFGNVRRCSQGFASYLISKGFAGEAVVVGYDKRFHSENFGAAVAEVLAANGLLVYLTDTATPTPVISYSVVAKQAVGAINITASHNPPTDNGFKVRDRFGGAIDPAGLLEIESMIPDKEEKVKRLNLAEGISNGQVIIFDPIPAYLNQINRLLDIQPIRDAGLKILVDPMWGNGAGWFPRLLSGGKTQVHEIHNFRNPIFPEMSRPEPIRPNIDVGLQTTLKIGADVLLITDGDADRVGIGDENGEFIDQLRAFGLLAYYLLEVRGMRGPIVKTLIHHYDAGQAWEDLQRPCIYYRSRFQIYCSQDVGNQRIDRRRRVWRVCLLRSRTRARWHPGRALFPGYDGPVGQETV